MDKARIHSTYNRKRVFIVFAVMFLIVFVQSEIAYNKHYWVLTKCWPKYFETCYFNRTDMREVWEKTDLISLNSLCFGNLPGKVHSPFLWIYLCNTELYYNIFKYFACNIVQFIRDSTNKTWYFGINCNSYTVCCVVWITNITVVLTSTTKLGTLWITRLFVNML